MSKLPVNITVRKCKWVSNYSLIFGSATQTFTNSGAIDHGGVCLAADHPSFLIGHTGSDGMVGLFFTWAGIREPGPTIPPLHPAIFKHSRSIQQLCEIVWEKLPVGKNFCSVACKMFQAAQQLCQMVWEKLPVGKNFCSVAFKMFQAAQQLCQMV